MIEKIDLLDEEKNIFQKLKTLANEFKELDYDHDRRMTRLSNAGDLAFELRNKLNNRGIQVKFEKDSLKNRSKCIKNGPESREFYDHPDIIVDLLRFVECPLVHDEIDDVTLGVIFSLFVWSKYEEKDIRFTIERTITGWKSFLNIEYVDAKNCSKLLYALREVYKISAPRDLESYFEITWEQAADGDLARGDLVARLQSLMNWISAAEKNKPELG